VLLESILRAVDRSIGFHTTKTHRRHQPLFNVLHATGTPLASSVALQLEVEAVGDDYVDLSEANENIARDQVHGVPAAILAETQGPIHCRCGEHDA
jgi:hypothetical protein